MKTYPENQCSCKKCASMCENRPCWGTPEEVNRMIDERPELATRLQEDYWVAQPDDVIVPSPAVVGREGKRAPFFPSGTCTFLKDGLCQLHDLGLKPLEGRVASCKASKKVDAMHEEMRLEIVEEWKSPEGLKTLERWRKLVGINSEPELQEAEGQMRMHSLIQLNQIAEDLKTLRKMLDI